MRVSLEVLEFRKAIRAISNMPERTAKRVIGASMRGAARVVRDLARPKIPVRTGALKKAVRVQTYRPKKRRGGGRLLVPYVQTIMAPRKGKKQPYYGIFIEKGFTTRGGRKIPGKHVIRNTFRGSLPVQRSAMIKETIKQVQRQLARLSAQNRVK